MVGRTGVVPAVRDGVADLEVQDNKALGTGAVPEGILVSDRATVFGFWAMGQRQIMRGHPRARRMTVAHTLRKLGKPVLEFIVGSVRARFEGRRPLGLQVGGKRAWIKVQTPAMEQDRVAEASSVSIPTGLPGVHRQK